ncbi:hypothetical protein ABZW30_44065 [Kitasatospora sp. NPDC004669]|uniref:hypothetical protein n=1 Tax=Kitasatospora sp. NPDC004669 TaxID=3154555 RepID=UPI0033A08695
MVPIALYYGLRAASVSVFVALLAGAFLPTLTTAPQWLRPRSLEGMAGLVAGTMLLGVAAVLVSGNPRGRWCRSCASPIAEIDHRDFNRLFF